MEEQIETKPIMICPGCKTQNMVDSVMHEDGIEYTVKLCKACGWWG